MKIGLIAYPTVCNFGANLQLLSTLEYYRNKGLEIEIVNWTPYNLENRYKIGCPENQYKVHERFQEKYYTMSSVCRTSEDVARTIEKDNITGIIIGSDAIAQHHPFFSRIVFPSRNIISIPTYTEDRMFPNVFWGDFQKYLEHEIPIAVLSASCQNSPFKSFSKEEIYGMEKAVSGYKYLSVRDKWTQSMYNHITRGSVVPNITPDPVFAFNYNVKYVPSKRDILEKFHLPQDYILLSFYNKIKINDDWIKKFQIIANANGYKCVALAFTNTILFNNITEYSIKTPLDPLDWYALIKYSSGYVGHNMHPIVVSLHNSIPFFSFDNYGIQHWRLFYNKKSSKIFDILERANMLQHRTNATVLTTKTPNPENVFDSLMYFDKTKCSQFSMFFYEEYKIMMNNITNAITK